MIFQFQGLMPPVLTAFSDDRYVLPLLTLHEKFAHPVTIGFDFNDIQTRGVVQGIRSEQRLLVDGVPAYAKYLTEKQGVKGVLVNGTSGEGMSMTVEERNASTEAWLEAAKGTDLKVMVQVGGACLKDVEAMAAHAEDNGAHALLCLPDLFNKPATCAELVAYLGHVGRAAPNTPLLYYHMPSYTNVNLSLAEVFVLAVKEVPTFAGAKFTSPNLEEGARVVSVAKQHGLSVFLGCDTILAGALALGFDSAIATTLNMKAGPSHEMLSASAKGDVRVTAAAQKRLTAFVDVITKHGGWVATMKAAMNVMTPIQVGLPRPPLKPVTEAQANEMKAEIAALLKQA